MTELSPTPLTPRCKECGTALELPGVAAELERLERSLAAAEARNAALVKALNQIAAWHGSKPRNEMDDTLADILRAALTEQQGGKDDDAA